MSEKPKTFKDALEQIEKLTDQAGPELRHRLEEELENLEQKYNRLKPQFAESKSDVEAKVRENPWLALGLIGLIGFVLGYLFSARGRD